jgi:Mn2+/Fe2+ NRAMP family transporter
MAVLEIDRERVLRRSFRERVLSVRVQAPSWLRALRLLLLVAGPGVLVMIGDNDAGGVVTYATTGARYGIGFFVPFLLLMIPVAYVVQEMTVRLGAASQKGHAELIFDRFGRFWGLFAMIDLVIGNCLTLVTEFIGMAAGLSLFGVGLWPAVVGSAALVSLIALFQRYLTVERVTLVVAAANLVFVPLALMAHPSTGQLLAALRSWSLPGGFTRDVLFLIIANVGTTIAPWMLFYQQAAVVDKGLTPRDIPQGQADTLLGSVIMGVIAVAIVVLTGAALYPHHVGVANLSDAQWAQTLAPFLGTAAARLFALGLIEAGLVAAVTISLSSAWAVGEVLGRSHSLNARARQAPLFYGIYVGSIAVAAAVVLLPHAPLELISLTVQVVATLLMPPALLFLLLLANDAEIMGRHRNGRSINLAAGGIIALILVLSIAYAGVTLFPNAFGA